jgi:hypothetical protein
MDQKILTSAACIGLAVFFAGTAWAQFSPGDNPPTFQSIGMLDALPADYAEDDCRVCHASGVPERHHVLYDQPIPAGSLVPYPDADGDGSPDTIYVCLSCHDQALTVVTDCVACHNAGSPHHQTPAAVDLQCTACHGDLVDNYDDGHYIPAYSPSLVTPYRGLDGDGYENPPFPTADLVSDGSGVVLPADVTVTAQGPPFFTVTGIGPLGTMHTRTEPNDLSFKPAGFNNDFVIRSTHYDSSVFSVVFTSGMSLSASWDIGAQTLIVYLAQAQTAAEIVEVVNAATGVDDVVALLGFDGDNPVLDLEPPEHYEPLGGDPPNNRGFGAGSCRYCHSIDGALDADGHPAGLIWDNRTLHHEIGLPSLVNYGAGTISACEVCHERVTVSEQSGPNFDFAIRYCERCHGPDSLHNIQADSANPGNIGTIVVGGEDSGFGHVGRDAGPGDSDCWGCHGFAMGGARALTSRPIIPTLGGGDPAVVRAGRDTTVFLVGTGFTSEADGVAYAADVRLTAADGSSVILSPKIAEQGLMAVTIPAGTAAGNHELRAVKERFASNPVVISVVPAVVITDVTADRATVTIRGSGFGGYAAGSRTSVTARVRTDNGKDGAPATVEGDIVSWSPTTIVVVFSGRPKQLTVNSVYGTATSDIGGRGRPDRRPRK